LIVTVKTQLAKFPFVSRAVQVTLFVPRSNALPLAGTQVMVTPQLSFVVGTTQVTMVLHCPGAVFATIAAGHVITGFSASRIVTVKVTLLLFPLLSLATHVTVVIPTTNVLPLAGVQVTLATAQLSLAVGATQATTLLHLPAIALVVKPRIGYDVNCGGSLSVIVTVKAAVPLFPLLSVAVQITVFTPIGKVEPLAGLQVKLAIAQFPEALGFP